MVTSQLPNETLNELLMIERTLWANDAQAYHDTYLPDAVLVFPDVGRIDRETAVGAIHQENADGRAWAEVHFDDAVGRWLKTNLAVLVSYCATARWEHESLAFQALCSTVYVRKAEAWRVAFHQQTPK